MEYVAFILAAWALIYAFVIESRRRRNMESVGGNVKTLQSQLAAAVKIIEQLEERLRGGLAAASPASSGQSAPVPITVPAHCAECGTALAAAAQFCVRCGTPVAAAKSIDKPLATPPPGAERTPAAAHTAPAYSPLVVPKPAIPATERPAPPVTPVPAVAPPPPPLQPRPADVTAHVAQPESKPASAPAPATSTPVRPAIPAYSAAAAGATAGSVPSRPTTPGRSASAPVPLRTTLPSGGPIFSSVAKPAPKKPARSFEEVLGMKWLPVVGITAVVVGVGFLVGSQWGVFPPWLRVLILYVAGLGLLVGGIYLERKVRYRFLGRGLIGGGWAVTALVTYAIANLNPLLVLPDKNVDLFLLLAVIGAMVWHTLKYNSQLVTGASFLLGFLAIGMNPSPPYNLIAGALLITGMTVIVVRRQWFELEIFGILASYANHFYWLYRVYEQQGGRAMFPHHGASVALVIGYWAIFRTSYLWRKIAGKEQESVSTFSALLNPILFLIVMKYQGFHPEWAWWVLLAMGAVEFLLGQLPVSRRRRAPFQILSSLGVTLMVASPLVKGSGNALEVIWLAGAEAFLLAGILTRERLFRAFGLIISFLVALYAVALRIPPLAQKIANGQPHHDGQIVLVLAVIAAALWANAHVTRRFWLDLFAEELETLSLSSLSFIASLFAVGAVYAYVPDNTVAVVLALLVAWLAGTGKLFSIAEMIYEAHWVAAVAFIQVIIADSSLATKWKGIPSRILAFASVAALLYLSSRFVRLSETRGKAILFGAYAWAATALLTILIWYQAAPWAVAVLWIVLGLALSLIGQTLKRTDLKWQAFALVLLSSTQALILNINLTAPLSGNPAATLSHITYRLLSVALIALGIYLLALWPPLQQLRPVYTGIGTLLVTLLAYKEAPQAWTAVAWIVLALALSAAALWFKQVDLRWQAFVLVIFSFARTLVVNFDLTETFHSLSLRLISVSLTALGIYLLARWAPLPQIRPVYSVAGTFLLAYLAFREAPAQWTGVFWVGLALVLCVAARWWKDRALLWQTHLLAALASGWTFYLFYDPQYRGTYRQLIAVSITAIVLYALVWLTKIAGVIEDERSCQAYAWAGSLLLSWLAWYQLPPNSVALAWGMFALLLFEFPDLVGSLKIGVTPWVAASWRAQAYVALAGAFVRVFIANFNVVGWAPALIVACLAAIYFFVYWELGRRELSRLEKDIHVQFLAACLGTATLAAIARFELPSDAVVIGYAGLVAGTLLIAWLARQQTFLFQALVMLGVAAFRIFMNNFQHLHEQFGSSLSGSIWAIALLACAVPLAFQVRKNGQAANTPRWFSVFALHPEQPLFFVPAALLVVLLFLKLSGGKLTGAWGVEGFVLFVLALLAKERSFRLTGLCLMLLSICKLVYDTFYFDDPQIRYMTWIGVGILILVVAFLYGRNREALRDYL